MTGFGLGVTDQPGAEALTGTEALAGIPAAPASTTAARKTDTFAALRPIRPPRERRRPSAGRTEDTIPARPAESAAGPEFHDPLQCFSRSSRDPWAVLSGRTVESGAVPRPGRAGQG